ncbi:MAG: hypothetical protein AAGH72_06165 [Verrucomicrobiota bacterium]
MLMLLAGIWSLAAQSAYTPLEKTFTITPSYSYKFFDRLRDSRGSRSLENFGINQIEQHNFTVSAEYGVTDDIAVDVSTGYVRSYSDGVFTPGDPEEIDGLSDTLIGTRWRFLNDAEFEKIWVPTLTARAGAILAGTYEEGFINSPGDGAFGFEYALLISDYFLDLGIGYYANLTHRARESVPDEFFGQVGIFKTLFKDFTVFTGYQRLQSLSGINVDSPQFTASNFQDLNEISDIIEYGVSYTDQGGRTYSIGAASVVGGKNVAESHTINVSATFSF